MTIHHGSCKPQWMMSCFKHCCIHLSSKSKREAIAFCSDVTVLLMYTLDLATSVCVHTLAECSCISSGYCCPLCVVMVSLLLTDQVAKHWMYDLWLLVYAFQNVTFAGPSLCPNTSTKRGLALIPFKYM